MKTHLTKESGSAMTLGTSRRVKFFVEFQTIIANSLFKLQTANWTHNTLKIHKFKIAEMAIHNTDCNLLLINNENSFANGVVAQIVKTRSAISNKF